jgi:chemotaxis protein MotB
MWLEIEINTDILFPSGAGDFSSAAEPVLDKLAGVLKPFPNPIRVEGHTDDRPIRTAAFPSNWELSAARAASVVHQFMKQGVDPTRLEIVGFGEFHPKQANDSVEGRNANRRVAILVLEELGAARTAATADATADASGRAPPPPGDPADGVDTTMVNNPHPRATQPPAQHIGPTELAWPASGPSEAKAPPPAHE